MVGTPDGVKVQLKALSDRRGALEAEIAQRCARLEVAGVGMAGALVDVQVTVMPHRLRYL